MMYSLDLGKLSSQTGQEERKRGRHEQGLKPTEKKALKRCHREHNGNKRIAKTQLDTR